MSNWLVFHNKKEVTMLRRLLALVATLITVLLFARTSVLVAPHLSYASERSTIADTASPYPPNPTPDRMESPGVSALEHSVPVTPENRTEVVSREIKLADMTPDRVLLELRPGESTSRELSISTGDVPVGKGDIMFVFDLTGSMADELAQAKSSAATIMSDVRAALPNPWFGVASFMDYPGTFVYPGYIDQYGDAPSGDQPWIYNIRPTDNIANVVNTIDSLSLGWGADWPESYTRVLYELPGVEWRPRTKKIVVLFGDAPTHDLSFAGYNFGGDPGADGVASTEDDLVFVDVVKRLAAEEISGHRRSIKYRTRG